MARNAFGTEKDALTTGEVARICNVAARTVSKWIDAGRLDGYRIPGSRDRRVHVSALEAFVSQNGIPVSIGALGSTDTTRVLVVDADRNASETVRTVLGDLDGYVVETASDALSAAVACGASTPDVIVFDVGAGDPKAFIGALRTRPNFARTCFVAVGTHFGDDGLSLVRAGFAATIRKPYSVRMLLDTLAAARATGTRRAG